MSFVCCPLSSVPVFFPGKGWRGPDVMLSVWLDHSWSVWSLGHFPTPFPFPRRWDGKEKRGKDQWKRLYSSHLVPTLPGSLADSRMLPSASSHSEWGREEVVKQCSFLPLPGNPNIGGGIPQGIGSHPQPSLWVTWSIRKCCRQWNRYPTSDRLWTEKNQRKPTRFGVC